MQPQQQTLPVDHVFVVPAYGASPYLDACLVSLRAQSVASNVIVATSTPTEEIMASARRHRAEVRLNPQAGGGIGEDWNFALSCAGAEWVTLAHQDDLYEPRFCERVFAAIGRHADAVLVATGYSELMDSGLRTRSTLLAIKRVLMETGFLGGERAALRWFKLNTLRFGCAIACPSVTLNIGRTGLRFRTDLKNNLDWVAWIDLAEREGAFIYLRELLMSHRVHESSETTVGLATGRREREDMEILSRLWPMPVARLIANSYGIAYRSNRV